MESSRMNHSGVFFTNNPNPMWVFELDTLQIKAVNNAAIDFYGYSEKEFLSMTIKELRPETEVEKLIAEVNKANKGLNKSGEWLHQKNNGEKVLVRIHSFPIDWNGSACKLVVAQDVIEQNDIEDSLLDERELLAVLTDNFPGTFYVFDEKGKLKRWNKRLEDITGYSSAEVEQMAPLGFIAPPERGKVQKKVEKAFEDGSAEIESVLVTKQGKEIPYFFRASTVQLENKTHLIGVGVNISALKDAQDELKQLYTKEKEERARIESINNRLQLMNQVSNVFATKPGLKKALDSIGNLLLKEVADICSIYLVQNGKPEKIIHKFHSTKIELLAEKVNQQFPQLMFNINLFNQVLENGEIVYEKNFTDDDLKQLGLQKEANEMLSRFGIRSFFLLPLQVGNNIIGVLSLIIVEDEREFYIDDESFLSELADKIALHTQNVQIEEDLKNLNSTLEDKVKTRTKQLEDANKELESFSYSVSHDLRAPLRAIAGYSNLLQEDHLQDLNEEGQEFLHIIHDETQRMGELIDELLSFSRMSRAEKNEVQVSVNELVSASLRDVKHAYPDENPEFEIGDLPDVSADPKLLKQVWMNLISNAVKYKKNGQRQHIQIKGEIDEKKKNIIYSVTDNGVGFDMEYADKLFGVFQRLHSDDEFEGTGIGLALSQRIINRHGGHIWAESKRGEGSTFYFSLPVNNHSKKIE